MISLEQLALLTIDAVNIGVGLLVLVKNPRHRVNRSFFIFVLGVGAWASGISLLYITHNFIFDKLALGGGLLLLFGIAYFARVFANDSLPSSQFFSVFIPLVIGAICLPFNVFITAIVVDSNGFIQPVNGPLFPFYVVLALGYLFLAFYFFIKNFFRSSGKARLQLIYLVTGITIFMASLAVFNVILPFFGIYQLNLVGPAASFIFVALTSYTIVRHQLMDIRIIIQRGAIYIVIISAIVSSYILLLGLLMYVFDAREKFAITTAAGIMTIAGILTVPPAERYFQRITDRFFFKDKYNYAAALEELGAVLNENIQLSSLIPNLLAVLLRIIKSESIEFTHVATGDIFDKDGSKPRGSVTRTASTRDIQIPVTYDQHEIGVFTFGPKRSGDLYLKEDMTLLRTFAAQAAVAFEKAELYQQLQEYSRSLEVRVEERTKDIRTLQERQRELFDDISHALQTPITVLKSTLELLAVEQGPQKARVMESMQYSVDDLARLTHDLLKLARIDAISTEGQESEINIGAVTEEVVEYVAVLCRDQGIRVIKAIEPTAVIVGSEKQFRELLTNLLSNAVQYTASRPIREIRIAVSSSKAFIELTIADTGIGIAPEDLPQIFTRFYRRSGRADASVGHGLGLAIVKRLVERHHGTIQVESILGEGTCFTVRFPRANGAHE